MKLKRKKSEYRLQRKARTGLNMLFLYLAVSDGKEVVYTHDPMYYLLHTNYDKRYSSELMYLQELYGETFTEDNFQREGDLWKLIL